MQATVQRVYLHILYFLCDTFSSSAFVQLLMKVPGKPRTTIMFF